ncbi:MAG TPA: L-histidine N(alpha)-methyltransferase [Chthoniobacterales bacterium]|nr:L-histidine N(alpha)-methyltransferase [Chthoniobacterales bacterium]
MTAPTNAVVDLSAKRHFRDDVIAGLTNSPRTLPCKYFYDHRGAELFQKICELPEYYITRTEIGILRLRSAEIATALGPDIELIGLGTGAGTKTRILLEELQTPRVYIPIDISKEQLEKSSARFRQRFPDLQILPFCADYLEPFELPLPRQLAARSVVYFPGSTIGNFEPNAAVSFLERLVDLVGDGGGLLIGVDLQKDSHVIEAAYNDAAGVTAAFNLNLLARINRELDADFDLKSWEHRANYNKTLGRVEMYLVSRTKQRVRIETQHFSFARGEAILTEYSYKYTPPGFAALARKAGFRFENLWSDKAQFFGVFYFRIPE